VVRVLGGHVDPRREKNRAGNLVIGQEREAALPGEACPRRSLGDFRALCERLSESSGMKAERGGGTGN